MAHADDERAGKLPGPEVASRPSGSLTAQELTDGHALGCEGAAQHRNAGVGIGAAAHENVDGGIARLGPRMDRNVALGQHRHARYAAVGLEVMQVDVQQGSAGRSDGKPQRLLDVIDIIETFGFKEIDDEMHPGAPHPVPHYEMIVPPLGFERQRRGDRDVFLSGGTWGPQVHPQLEEGVLAHAVLPNQRSNPRRRRAGSTESECRWSRPECGPIAAARLHITATYLVSRRFLIFSR